MDAILWYNNIKIIIKIVFFLGFLLFDVNSLYFTLFFLKKMTKVTIHVTNAAWKGSLPKYKLEDYFFFKRSESKPKRLN